MADYPRRGSEHGTIRSHGEQIRRIRTRIPNDLPIDIYELTDADLYNDSSSGFEGWQTNSTVKFSRQGNVVNVVGAVQWTGSTGGYPYSPLLIVRALPAPVIPDASQARVLISGQTAITVEYLWATYLFAGSGIVSLADQHGGSPTFPWGDLSTGTPVISLNFTYPLITSAP
jgi:hypothetical protein